MFERFTDKARKVVIKAKAKATERGDDQIRPVHMLYGLVSTDGMAASALGALGVDSAAVERELGRMTPRPWRRSASTWTRSGAGSRTASARTR